MHEPYVLFPCSMNQHTDYAQLNERAEISSELSFDEKLNFYLWSYLMPEKLKFT